MILDEHPCQINFPPPPRKRKQHSAEYQVIKGQIALHLVTDNYLKLEAITAHISEINNVIQ